MILTLGHMGKFKVTRKKSAELVTGLYLSNRETLKVPTQIAYDLRVCQNFDLM